MKKLAALSLLLLASICAWAATSTAFQAMTPTLTISGSTTTASAAWGASQNAGDCLRVFNSTTAIAFIHYGNGAQTATTADIPIAPGAVEVIQVGGYADTVAVILSTGTGSVYVTKGSGL